MAKESKERLDAKPGRKMRKTGGKGTSTVVTVREEKLLLSNAGLERANELGGDEDTRRADVGNKKEKRGGKPTLTPQKQLAQKKAGLHPRFGGMEVNR